MQKHTSYLVIQFINSGFQANLKFYSLMTFTELYSVVVVAGTMIVLEDIRTKVKLLLLWVLLLRKQYMISPLSGWGMNFMG